MELGSFLIYLAIAWLVALVFLVATTMHFATYNKWKVNKWIVGGITAAVWILISWIFVVVAGR